MKDKDVCIITIEKEKIYDKVKLDGILQALHDGRGRTCQFCFPTETCWIEGKDMEEAHSFELRTRTFEYIPNLTAGMERQAEMVYDILYAKELTEVTIFKSDSLNAEVLKKIRKCLRSLPNRKSSELVYRSSVTGQVAVFQCFADLFNVIHYDEYVLDFDHVECRVVCEVHQN